jgi:hypothetical protein
MMNAMDFLQLRLNGHFLRSSVAMLMCLFAFGLLSAQSTGAWDEEDDEEDETEEVIEDKALVDDRPASADEARIWLNGESMSPDTKQLTVHRGDTLTITVRDLAPGTSVVIQAAKGGINLSKKAFYANSKGELDLEIRLGSKKMKGLAKLNYTPSNGKRREKEVHIEVD